MALWQYTFFIVPKESYDFLSLQIRNLLTEDGFDSSPFWKYKLLNKKIFDEVENFLNKGVSWCEDIDLYGSEKSNCLEVLFDKEENIESVSFRIDFTTDFELILSGIIEFCIFKSFIILDQDLNATPLNYELVKSIIYAAPQVKKYNDLSKG